MAYPVFFPNRVSEGPVPRAAGLTLLITRGRIVTGAGGGGGEIKIGGQNMSDVGVSPKPRALEGPV